MQMLSSHDHHKTLLTAADMGSLQNKSAGRPLAQDGALPAGHRAAARPAQDDLLESAHKRAVPGTEAVAAVELVAYPSVMLLISSHGRRHGYALGMLVLLNPSRLAAPARADF